MKRYEELNPPNSSTDSSSSSGSGTNSSTTEPPQSNKGDNGSTTKTTFSSSSEDPYGGLWDEYFVKPTDVTVSTTSVTTTGEIFEIIPVKNDLAKIEEEKQRQEQEDARLIEEIDEIAGYYMVLSMGNADKNFVVSIRAIKESEKNLQSINESMTNVSGKVVEKLKDELANLHAFKSQVKAKFLKYFHDELDLTTVEGERSIIMQDYESFINLGFDDEEFLAMLIEKIEATLSEELSEKTPTLHKGDIEDNFIEIILEITQIFTVVSNILDELNLFKRFHPIFAQSVKKAFEIRIKYVNEFANKFRLPLMLMQDYLLLLPLQAKIFRSSFKVDISNEISQVRVGRPTHPGFPFAFPPPPQQVPAPIGAGAPYPYQPRPMRAQQSLPPPPIVMLSQRNKLARGC